MAGKLGSLQKWFEARINLTEVFSLLSIFGFFYREVDTTKPISVAIREALSKPLPSYSRWPRVLGLLVFLLFGFEVVTGGLLAFYYRPTPAEAYDSVLTISRDVSFGWFVRQTHFWGAQALLVILVARLIRFFFSGLYRAPRELIWVSLALLFVVTTHLDFSGRLLAWNNEAYWASTRAIDLLSSIPLVGGLFNFLIGGLDLQSYPLTRFYFLHIAVLPIVFWILYYFSFSGIRRVGLSEIPGDESRPAGGRTYLAHLISLLMLLLVVFGTLVTLAVLLPVPFGYPVDPSETPTGSSMAWYLLAPYGFVEFLPSWLPFPLRSTLLFLIVVAIVLLPAIDSRSRRPQSERRLARLGGAVVLVLWLFFTYYGMVIDLMES